MNEHLRNAVEDMLETPGMYGPQIAVETQILFAFDLISRLKWPEYTDTQHREMLVSALRSVFQAEFGTYQLPASAHSLSMYDFVRVLTKMRDAFYKELEVGLPEEEDEA